MLFEKMRKNLEFNTSPGNISKLFFFKSEIKQCVVCKNPMSVLL